MTLYTTTLHTEMLAPENLGSKSLAMTAVQNSVRVEGAKTPVITTASHWYPEDRVDLSSCYVAVRENDGEGSAAPPDYGIRVSSSGRLQFPEELNSRGGLFVSGPTAVNGARPNLVRAAPGYRLRPGRNTIFVSSSWLGIRIVDRAIDTVTDKMGANHPDASRALALQVLRAQENVEQIMVATVDVAARSRAERLGAYARLAGFTALLPLVARVAMEAPAVFAAIAVLGVGSAIIRVLLSPLVRDMGRRQAALARQQEEAEWAMLTAVSVPRQRVASNRGGRHRAAIPEKADA